MAINDELLDRLIARYRNPEGLIDENDLLKQLTKWLIERAMQVEMAEHLGYANTLYLARTTEIHETETSKKTIKGRKRFFSLFYGVKKLRFTGANEHFRMNMWSDSPHFLALTHVRGGTYDRKCLF